METLEKLRNGIEQLPKWLLLILVFVLGGALFGVILYAPKIFKFFLIHYHAPL